MSSSATPNQQLQASKLYDVSNYTAIVTGGGTGIGLMITQTLKANGAKVYITGRRDDALEKVVEKYNDGGKGSIVALPPADISNKDDILKMVKEVEGKEPNGIHLLVNNAGIAADDNTKYSNGEPDFKSAKSISEHLWKSDPESWGATFATNVTAQFFVATAFLPLLSKTIDTKKGFTPSIINITSISGVMKGSSNGQFAYAASKAAFIQLTRMLATTLVEAKIRVNSIAPGVFPSEMTAGKSDENQKSEMNSEASNPSGRYGSEEDMGNCVLFLAGPASTWLNGQIVYPDGACT
ncbi:putative Rhamnolipids biosynthesis 3-oxoacyl-[acyl-carrier-protein] reductase [Glarea lozoyensis 74030]|uniref:Putative Rhamnolipids biosynthesis 3-oxoacyl-[acyl-carrier-protein] reductase n=1 Tax=Glarea lozoyensis (strain ATCC 74030 / MF5533) TaxID=1104152 RepID=H0ELM2_GLAL7|nr:putative Rhamnolipids biosynthesis 3-oxoacyl-[acyl-carrier-protein] reductase [Glarea lozoyensis 74030]